MQKKIALRFLFSLVRKTNKKTVDHKHEGIGKKKPYTLMKRMGIP